MGTLKVRMIPSIVPDQLRLVEDAELRPLRQLIWIYFWLLIFEGALRKWIFPELANALLVIRDPFLLLAYALALRRGLFPRNAFLTCAWTVGGLAFITSMLWGDVGKPLTVAAVTLFGFRANFLHLPLIYLIPAVFDRSRVLSVGKFILLLSGPMAALVFLQYTASPLAWINRGAGTGDVGQIGVAVAGVDKIRAAGLFSYNMGLTSFLSLLAAFILSHFAAERLVPRWLAYTAAASLLASAVLAVSRTTVITLLIILAAVVLAGFVRARFHKASLRIGATGLLLVALLASWSAFGESWSILMARVQQAHGIKLGIGARFLDGFLEPFTGIGDVPFFGFGLGVGTNVGAGLLTGSAQFLLAEGEWARLVREMGPLLGIAFILIRIGIAGNIVYRAFHCLRADDLLPWLLCSTCCLPLVVGQFGQATTLGFAVFGAGLCLASMQRPPVLGESEGSHVVAERVRPMGRSFPSRKLHES